VMIFDILPSQKGRCENVREPQSRDSGSEGDDADHRPRS